MLILSRNDLKSRKSAHIKVAGMNSKRVADPEDKACPAYQ